MSELKQIIKKEYLKCAKDPAHFMRKYCKIQHPQRGTIPFDLYPFQSKTLHLLRDNPYSIILKSRQLGISTLSAGYSLWLMLFNRDKNVLCIATKTDTAKNMVTKVKFMYDNLPSWMTIEAVEKNKLSLKLANGSQIKAVSAAGDAGRSEAVSLLLIDEAAFIENIGEIWASAQQTLATGGGCIALSTPYGTGNWFHQTWVKAEQGENKFLPIRLPWSVHPERDQTWRDMQDKLLGDPRYAAQECDCDFNSSGDVVFYNEYLEEIENRFIQDPIEKRGANRDLWIWEYPDYSKTYLVSADVARGDGADYSAFHVFDIESSTQVAEFKGQLSTKEYANLLFRIGMEYNNAMVCVENANIGWATLQELIDLEYPSLYYSPRSGEVTADSYFDVYSDVSKMTPGFTMSTRTRPMVVSKFQEYVMDLGVTIRSRRLLEEMRVFIWLHGKAEAQKGYNDDLVMACGMGLYVRDTALKFRTHGLNQTWNALNNMTKTKAPSHLGAYNPNNIGHDQYNLKIGNNQNEDLKWLL